MRDAKTEQQLKRGGFAFRFEAAFAIARIDLNAAKANPARLLRKLDEDRCLEMGYAMEQQVDFPAIVLIEFGNTLQLATGLHRLIAATEWCNPPLKTFDTYVVNEKDAYRRELLVRSINSIEGKGQSREENLAHCVEMLRAYPGHTVDDIAVAFNLPARTVREHLNILKLEERAQKCGVSHLLRDNKLFPLTTKRELIAIKGEPLFAGLIRVIATTKASGRVARQLIQEVHDSQKVSEAAGFKVLEQHEKEWAEQEARAQAKYGRRRPDIPTRALAKVRSILRIPYAQEPSRLQFSALEPAQLSRDLQVLYEVIQILLSWKREMLGIQKQHEANSCPPLATGASPSVSTSANA